MLKTSWNLEMEMEVKKMLLWKMGFPVWILNKHWIFYIIGSKAKMCADRAGQRQAG